MFLNNRYHDPVLGGFISVDPLVTQTGQAYIYGAGNPIQYSDPSGLYTVGADPDDPCHPSNPNPCGGGPPPEPPATTPLEFAKEVQSEIDEVWETVSSWDKPTKKWYDPRRHLPLGGGSVLGPLGTIEAPDFTDQLHMVALVLLSLEEFGRRPDYVVFEGAFTTGGLDVGVEVVVTRYGDIVVAPEAGVGFGSGLGGSVRAGWVTGSTVPGRDVLKGDLLGTSVSGEISGALLALTVTAPIDLSGPPGPVAVEVGISYANTLGGSIDVSYGLSAGRVNVSW